MLARVNYDHVVLGSQSPVVEPRGQMFAVEPFARAGPRRQRLIGGAHRGGWEPVAGDWGNGPTVVTGEDRASAQRTSPGGTE